MARRVAVGVLGAIALLAGCANVGDWLTSPSTARQALAQDSPQQLVHQGGVVLATARILSKALFDQGPRLAGRGGSVISNNAGNLATPYHTVPTYRTQATYAHLVASIEESQQTDGTWEYFLDLDGTHGESIVTQSRLKLTATDSVVVPDSLVLRDWALTEEGTESVPPDAPPGAIGLVEGIRIVVGDENLIGTQVAHKVVVPQPDGREMDWRTTTDSREVRFKLPSVPALDGKPLIQQQVASRYQAQAGSWPVPLQEVEQETWPDGMRTQQTTTRTPDLARATVEGQMSFTDPRPSVSYHQVFDYQAGTATHRFTTSGVTVELYYLKDRFSTGEIRDANGRHLADLRPLVQEDELAIVYPDGSQETVTAQ
jgi:hypothetical protein